MKFEPYFLLINDSDHFRILCESLDDQNQTIRNDILVIQKKGCKIFTRQREIKDEEEREKQIKNYGIIGILNVTIHIFIILITEKEEIAKLPSGDKIYLVKQVEFIPFAKNIWDY